MTVKSLNGGNTVSVWMMTQVGTPAYTLEMLASCWQGIFYVAILDMLH